MIMAYTGNGKSNGSARPFVSEYKISSGGATSPSTALGTGAASQLQALNDLIGYRAGDPGYSAALDVSALHKNLYEQSFSLTTRNGINLNLNYTFAKNR